MRRWCSITDFVTNDQERLQRITIHAADEDKQSIKVDTKGFNHTRLLLVTEKSHKSLLYSISKISRI